MIKVIIVDDDIEMLHGLVNIIDWEKYGFKITGQADNGNDALELARQHVPDIIITDITMPFMNGINLLKEIKQFKPDIKSIILTCHQDFNYAREAIELDADFYLVKYTLTGKELLKSLLKLKQKLDQESSQKEMLNRINQELNQNKQVIKEKFIKDILEQKYKNKTDIFKKAGVIGLSLPEGLFRAVGIFINNYPAAVKASPIDEDSLLRFSIQNILEDMFLEEKDANVFSLSNYAYLVIYSESRPNEGIRQKLRNTVNELQKSIYSILNIKMSVCIGHVYESILQIGIAISDIMSLRESSFYEKSDAVVTTQINYAGIDTDDLYEKFIGDFRKAIISRDRNLANHCIDVIFHEIDDKRYNPQVIKKFFKYLAADIQSYANKNGIFFDVLDMEGDTLEYYKTVINDKVTELFNELASLENTAYRKEIKKVLEYIDNNLEQNISGEMMAEYVNMNSSYFSRLFKNEVGTSFSEYLVNKKIERATKLLTETDMTAEEVSKAVGYSNASYFYRIYKRVTGKTTRKIRDTEK